eukprot:GILI01006474.1.p1 GENE.GILI01006474.1~~GILI01006474.1.p1  ORF type:complete len:145 (-),score=38.84 GILI01006474.1:138-530(-)
MTDSAPHPPELPAELSEPATVPTTSDNQEEASTQQISDTSPTSNPDSSPTPFKAEVPPLNTSVLSSPPARSERQESAEEVQRFILKSGLHASFQLICAEILTQRIPPQQVFQFAARRMREIGQTLKSEAH